MPQATSGALFHGWPLALGLLLAAGPLAAGDVLRPLNTATNDMGALVDGFDGSAAVNDERYTAPDLGGFLNALFPAIPIASYTSDVGRNEVFGFARRRPPRLVEEVPWTPATNIVELPFEDEYLIAVHVWIVQGPFASVSASAAEAALTTSRIWAEERLGVAFSSFSIVDATVDPDAASLVDFDCSKAGAIQQLIGHDPSGVNVYYVNTVDFGSGPSTGSGVWCFGDRIVAMGKTSSDHLLAHELGHGFNLGHTNPASAPAGLFDSTNVMHNSSSNRRYLTEGQTLRAVFHSMSALNEIYDVRAGELTRDCAHEFGEANGACPPVQKRIWSDGAGWPPN